MKLNTLPASRGWAWLVAGLRLYRRNPLALMSNVALMWLTLTFSGILVIPLLSLVFPRELASWLSQLPLALLLPPLSVGVFKACAKIARGEAAPTTTVFTGLAGNLPSLFALGAIYFAGSLVAFQLLTLADGGLLLEAMRNPKRLEEASTSGLALARSGLSLLGLSLPIMMINWFAPVLAGLRGLPPLKAAFFSFVACWRNWRAFTSFGLALAGLFWVLPALLGALIALVSPSLAMSLVVIVPVTLSPALYGAFYANALEVFPELDDSPSDGDA
jgi:hypothetical protein